MLLCLFVFVLLFISTPRLPVSAGSPLGSPWTQALGLLEEMRSAGIQPDVVRRIFLHTVPGIYIFLCVRLFVLSFICLPASFYTQSKRETLPLALYMIHQVYFEGST